jgi:hypothetical protein
MVLMHTLAPATIEEDWNMGSKQKSKQKVSL